MVVQLLYIGVVVFTVSKEPVYRRRGVYRVVVVQLLYIGVVVFTGRWWWW